MSGDPRGEGESGVKETLVSLIISLAMALIVKCYVVEAYRIPTGSMAPTLLGVHATYTGPQTGRSWFVDRGRPGEPPDQRGLLDPVTGLTHPGGPRVNALRAGATSPGARPAQAGDRILVQKYLYDVTGPERFDVVVFRNPTNVRENYIKRLVGLPNEHLWLADGDVFRSPFQSAQDPADAALAAGTWECQRKSLRTQRSLWRTLFSSEYTPLEPKSSMGGDWFQSPWSPRTGGWEMEGRRSYRYGRHEPTALAWDTIAWPVTDWEPYNDRARGSVAMYPVSDVRMRCNVEPEAADLTVTATITARQHEFQVVLGQGQATLQMRAASESGAAGPWTVLDSHALKAMPVGRSTPIEFWHVDQALHVFVHGKRVLYAEYNWDPAQRLAFATGQSFESLRTNGRGGVNLHALADPATYAHGQAEVEWRFSGGPFTLHQVGLDRDIFYQPALGSRREVGFGCHPDRVVTLGPDHFFMLGDNSADSLDGRGWPDFPSNTPYGRTVDPFVAEHIDPAPGVVHRKLILGKTFFVYFPAPLTVELFGFKLPIPVPDFGHMRIVE
ncbi:MAG: signal peptidase I [Phycisphaerales bacterium]|nr:signal peptidase I [Phycisphaerales bacterium]